MLRAYWTKSVGSLLLAGLLLTSCSQADPNINIIGSHYNNNNYKDYIVNPSIRECPVTQWNEFIKIGSTLNTRLVKTECVNAYRVEVINTKNQFIDSYVFEYKLTDHRVNILVRSATVLLENGKALEIGDYLKELNK